MARLLQEQHLPEPSGPVIIQQRIPNFSANALASAMQPFSRSTLGLGSGLGLGLVTT